MGLGNFLQKNWSISVLSGVIVAGATGVAHFELTQNLGDSVDYAIAFGGVATLFSGIALYLREIKKKP